MEEARLTRRTNSWRRRNVIMKMVVVKISGEMIF
jgi:hypothetical protein